MRVVSIYIHIVMSVFRDKWDKGHLVICIAVLQYCI